MLNIIVHLIWDFFHLMSKFVRWNSKLERLQGMFFQDLIFWQEIYFIRLVWRNFKRTLLHIQPGLLVGPKPITSPQTTVKSCSHLSKSLQNVKNSDFQSQFTMSKMILFFLKKIIEEYHLWSSFFVIDIFWQLQFLILFIS